METTNKSTVGNPYLLRVNLICLLFGEFCDFMFLEYIICRLTLKESFPQFQIKCQNELVAVGFGPVSVILILTFGLSVPHAAD